MKKIILIAIVIFGSNFAKAQESQDSFRQKAVQRMKEKFPETRRFNFEYNQSFNRRFSSELFDQGFQEGDIKSQHNFMAAARYKCFINAAKQTAY
jgi:hypothetical protein